MQAWFRTSLVVVTSDIDQLQLPIETSSLAIDDLLRSSQLVTCRKQVASVFERPPIELSIGELDTKGLETFGQLNEVVDSIDIASMQEDVRAPWQINFACGFDSLQLFHVRSGASNGIRQFGLVSLKTDLDGIEAGNFETIARAVGSGAIS